MSFIIIVPLHESDYTISKFSLVDYILLLHNLTNRNVSGIIYFCYKDFPYIHVEKSRYVRKKLFLPLEGFKRKEIIRRDRFCQLLQNMFLDGSGHC